MIEVRNVSKKYGKFTAVNNINFRIKEGEIVGFLGPNGAGKSTTMNMITGYIEPTEGQIAINGLDISKDAKKAKKLIGYMPESTPLYQDMTVVEFISYMAELRGLKKQEIKIQIDKVLNKTGLSEVSTKLIRNLSRGYKQRVSLSGALIGDPEIIILDEPTVGLDPKQITEIRELIKGLGKEHTVILSSHILSEVSQICEKVIIINNGKIVAVDSPKAIENSTKEENIIVLTVEDNDNKLENVVKDIEEVEECKLINTFKNNTKKYELVLSTNDDIRKKVSHELAKNDILIVEMVLKNTTLEDAFIKLISQKEENNDEISIDEKKEDCKEKKNKMKKIFKKNKKEEE